MTVTPNIAPFTVRSHLCVSSGRLVCDKCDMCARVACMRWTQDQPLQYWITLFGGGQFASAGMGLRGCICTPEAASAVLDNSEAVSRLSSSLAHDSTFTQYLALDLIAVCLCLVPEHKLFDALKARVEAIAPTSATTDQMPVVVDHAQAVLTALNVRAVLWMPSRSGLCVCVCVCV